MMCAPRVMDSGGLGLRAVVWRSLRLEQTPLQVLEDRHRPRVDAFAGSEMERDEVPHEHQVEELGQVPLTLGAHLDDVSYDLSKHIRDEGEAPGQLGMLGVVTQIDEGDDLAGDIPVLA